MYRSRGALFGRLGPSEAVSGVAPAKRPYLLATSAVSKSPTSSSRSYGMSQQSLILTPVAGPLWTPRIRRNHSSICGQAASSGPGWRGDFDTHSLQLPGPFACPHSRWQPTAHTSRGPTKNGEGPRRVRLTSDQTQPASAYLTKALSAPVRRCAFPSPPVVLTRQPRSIRPARSLSLPITANRSPVLSVG